MNRPLDLRVTIERVHVRCRATAERRRPPLSLVGYLDGRAGAPPHDHRIVVRELRIDVEATLDASRARSLGKAVAAELADQLATLQAERTPSIVDAPATGGPIHVALLCVYLWGEPARHPPSRDICTALIAPLEERIRHG
ncbi:MAG TPA: hypothetical protein VHW23_43205 [Kofleriaceae bacterium]|jgi:hypothetical protein|nr:hypothetical protein [Kofleriaceae bacterium]